MNTLAKTLLLLSIVLCAFPDGAVLTLAASPDATPVKEAGSTSRPLFRRSAIDNLTSIVENFVTDVSSVPLDVLQDLSRVGRVVLYKIESLFRSIAALFDKLVPWQVSTFLDPRSRRSLPGMSDILALNPIATLARTIRSARDVAEEQIETVLSTLMNLGFDFLTTKALPWLRETVDAIAKTPNLPSTLRTAIDDFDALYGLLQFLGVVGSSAAG